MIGPRSDKNCGIGPFRPPFSLLTHCVTLTLIQQPQVLATQGITYLHIQEVRDISGAQNEVKPCPNMQQQNPFNLRQSKLDANGHNSMCIVYVTVFKLKFEPPNFYPDISESKRDEKTA